MEIDKMKTVLRRTLNYNALTFENDAEHSYIVAVMSMALKEYANSDVDMNRVIPMLLVHDMVEVYAGDTFAYDTKGYTTKSAREAKAADKLFSMLPEDIGSQFRDLFEEFDTMTTAEARFANAVDRIQPILLNAYGSGGAWHMNQVTQEQVYQRIAMVKDVNEELYFAAQELIDTYFGGNNEL
ncbi:HD domain-containing protein [Peptoniphilus equinus]|uniref:HD domain-containing protein n=1 Tax=Peptoniphilus equinus TaxID=3016343 RepID=A0ABY7QX85_9FIRM|nr:HD domain-containing protein [Peptoniphilus equinus]WBW50710.1 HD domain-containing protein [Peptoniphilus equinus]